MNASVKKLLKSVSTPNMRWAVHACSVRVFTGIKMMLDKRKAVFPCGVNLVGYIRGDFGLGESCRLVAGALKTSGIPFSVYRVPIHGDAPENNMDWVGNEQESLPYCVNLIHLNPDGMARDIWKLGTKIFANRYNIGFFLWEQMDFPQQWDCILELVDEIWTPAEFVSRSIQKRTQKPVFTMPYGLLKPNVLENCNRKYFGLPENVCLFLVSYDGYSCSERKNPMASVRAYCNAFSQSEACVGLVIKATHASDEDLQAFQQMLKGYPNIYVLTDSFSKAEFNSLLQCIDVYVSLHRAEGFGLVMAEAMMLGTAVIATNWSANTEFMNDEVAWMVPADIIELDKDVFPYQKGTHWAQPDEKNAAKGMQELFKNKKMRQQLCANAQRHIEMVLSQQMAAERMKKRLSKLWEKQNLKI